MKVRGASLTLVRAADAPAAATRPAVTDAPVDLAVRARTLLRALAAPLVLYLIALAMRAAVAGLIHFPSTEDGAYYLDAARRLVEGHGLTTLALWSYATPPLELPRPAFEIWMPAASLWSVPFMAVLGTTFGAAQVGSVVLGAAIAPMTWWLGRESARSCQLPSARQDVVAMASGLIAALLGPLVLASADPDSTGMFLVCVVAAAMLMPRMIDVPSTSRGIVLGLLLAAAYLSRQEAVWLAVAYCWMLARTRHGWISTAHPAPWWRSATWDRLAPVVVGGALLTVPWLLRQWLSFGSPLPGQALQNALQVRGSDIFAYLDQPTLARYLAQGLGPLLGSRIDAVTYQLTVTLLLAAFPVGCLGIAGVVLLRREPALRPPTALHALLVSGAITFCVTALVFPVATLWGTYRHDAGPLLVACIVLAVLVMDRAVGWLGRLRHWQRPSFWLGPIVILAAAVVPSMAMVQVTASRTADLATRMSALTTMLDSEPDVTPGSSDTDLPAASAALMSDQAIYLAWTIRRPTIALPDEPIDSVLRLADRFGVRTLVLLQEPTSGAAELLATGRCLVDAPRHEVVAAGDIWVLQLRAGCSAS